MVDESGPLVQGFALPPRRPGRLETIAGVGQETLLHRFATEHKLNDSQRAALSGVLGQHITFIPGPPGTGKTSLAAALLCFMHELHQGPVLAVAQSNAGVDNIARRVRGEQLKVSRYGFRVAADLEEISTVALAEKREGK